MNVLVIGFGAGIGVAAWRNLPPISEPVAAVWVACVLVAVLAAYVAGLARGRGTSASAVAVASAVADSSSAAQSNVTVNVLSATSHDGTRVAGGVAGWTDTAHARDSASELALHADHSPPALPIGDALLERLAARQGGAPYRTNDLDGLRVAPCFNGGEDGGSDVRGDVPR